MRRAWTALLLASAMLAGASPARSDNVSPGSVFCEGGLPVRGDGAPSQVAVHARILSKAFARACRKEAGLVSYLGTGTRRAVTNLTYRRLPFVGSDVPLSSADWLLVQKSDYTSTVPVHQIPLYIETWAVAYNVPCAGPQLRLRSSVLAAIYSGLVTTWDHRLLTVDNPWLAECAHPIRLARRVDEAASTDAFQDYLAKRNPLFVAYRKELTPQRWPTSSFACSGLGEAGMVNCVRSFRGSIGYASLAVARQNRLRVALVENAGGAFVEPASANCTAAASTAVPPPGTRPVVLPGERESPWLPATTGDWSTVSITDAPNGVGEAPSYPICSFSYVFVLQNWLAAYTGFASTGALRALVDYLLVALRPATQSQLAAAGYAALPDNFRGIAEDGVRALSYFRYTTGPI